MDQRPEGRVERPVNSLADLRLSDQTLDSLLVRIGRLAVASLPGWDAVGASLVEKDKVTTFGVTDDRIGPVDQAQYDAGRGPCVDALKSGEVRYFDGTDIEPRWRHFSEAAADAGIYSVLSFPLRLDDEVIGALNFYSNERDAQRPGDREEGLLFSSQAAVTVANARELSTRDVQIDQLNEGLQTRTMIGQATGLLMAQEGLSSDEAFQKLVTVSQASNVKLRDIAQRYVEAWETNSPLDP